MTTTATEPTEAPPEVAPEVQRAIEELRTLTAKITEADAEMNRMAVRRSALMLTLHDAGFNNVQIAGFMGLTRQRVSTLMAPAIAARLGARGTASKGG